MAFILGAIVVVAVVVTNLPAGGLQSVATSRVTTSTHTTATTTTATTTTTKPTVTRPQPAPPATAGTYKVASYSLTLEEPWTQAGATGQSASGQWIRTLPTIVLYPKSKTRAAAVQGAPAPDYKDGPFPLVVFSQGFYMPTSAYLELLNAWASAGYVVAAPTYPRTDPSLGLVNENDMGNHPADLRFVISSLTAAAKQSGNLLHKLVNGHKVGIIGHSDGGDVSLAVAANTCCQDPAVKAAVILSGAESTGFGGTYFASGNRSVPLLVAQGDADTVNVLSCSAQLYDQAPGPKYYLDIPKAGHEQPYLNAGPWQTGVIRSVVAFLNGYLKNSSSSVRSLVRQTLPGGEVITTDTTVPNEPTVGCQGSPSG